MPRRGWGLAPAAIVLVGLFVLPLSGFLVISFWSVRARMMRPDLTLANYAATLRDYGDTLLTTLATALAVASVTTLLAFALAYAIRFRIGRWGDAVLFLTLVTLFGGYLVKIYAWKSILGREGVLNQALMAAGAIAAPVDALLYSRTGVVVTLCAFLLPFATLPIHGALRGVRDVTLEAARDLGAGPGRVLVGVVLPQCRAGLLVAFALCFLVAAGDYVTPRFVGGGAAMMGTFIETQFSIAFNWPMGSAMAFTVLAAAFLVVAALDRGLRWTLRP